MNREILASLYNLCILNKDRQKEAVSAGIVPHLMVIIQSRYFHLL